MPSRARHYLLKSLRLSTYLAVVAVGLSAVGVRSVHARGRKAALAIGEPLADIDVPSGEATVLRVNGQRLRLASAHVDASVHAVLDRMQSACETHADGLGDDLGELDGAMARPPSERGFPGIGLLRDERDGRGVVACFAAGERTDDLGALRRVARFAASHDLADLGGLRYVAARADDGGGTRITATWSDDALSLDAMFPDEGDAPGEDPSAAPRPSGAHRVLSARVEPAPYGAFVYTTDETRDAALARYEHDLAARGFRPIGSDGGDRDKYGRKGRAYRAGLVDVLVTATDGSSGAAGTLSIVESHYDTVRGTR